MGTITIVLPAVKRWFFQELCRGAGERAGQLGHHVEIRPVSEGGPSAIAAIEAAFSAENALGAVVAGFQHRGGSSDRALALNRPVVIVGGSVLGFPVVSFDDVGVGLTVTRHLTELGHTRIAHITGPLDPDHAFLFMRRRARGYRMVMEGAGYSPDVVESAQTLEALRAATRTLLTRPDRPTAVFAVFDEVAFVVMDVAEELGLVIGRDLSVVGVNDHPDAAGRDLTTARHRPSEVGATSVEMLLDGLAAGPDASKSRLHPTTFVRRGSTRRVQRV